MWLSLKFRTERLGTGGLGQDRMGLFLGGREPILAHLSPTFLWAPGACGESGDSGGLGSRWMSCWCPQTLLPGNPPPASWESCGKLRGCWKWHSATSLPGWEH